MQGGEQKTNLGSTGLKRQPASHTAQWVRCTNCEINDITTEEGGLPTFK